MTGVHPGRPIRLGLVGFGYIGSRLYHAFAEGDGRIEPVFVYNRSVEKLSGLPREHVCLRLEDVASFAPDMIVEVCHPGISASHGARFLQVADYLPLSVSALVDDNLRAALTAAAMDYGHRLLLPHGALVAADDLLELRDRWQDVCISFHKPPASIDFSRIDQRAEAISSATVLYDGPVRGIARLFPHNVNAMVSCALATVGVDRCRGILVADPDARQLRARVEARAADGARLVTEKSMPAAGVSGTEMVATLERSIRKAAGLYAALDFV